ncbi:hypothetical protein GCM10022240_29870 [Microbacterium kribbense]|uniref:Uncharacterized protein n=1 Tax=Microbacterium kribbense TaxID=433645 RepID=A0ABP7GX83_9MICO
MSDQDDAVHSLTGVVVQHGIDGCVDGGIRVRRGDPPVLTRIREQSVLGPDSGWSGSGLRDLRWWGWAMTSCRGVGRRFRPRRVFGSWAGQVIVGFSRWDRECLQP